MTPKEIRKQLANHDKYLDVELSDKTKEELKERAERFAINLNDLDEEAARQPAEYAYYAYTLGVHETIAAKARMKEVKIKAEIVDAIKRNDPRDGRSGGPTITQIDAMVQNDLNYQQAVADVKNAEHRVALLNADVTASAQKAAMLKLFSQRYNRETQMKGFIDDGKKGKTK
jgi:hypothetical protein